MVKSSAFKFMPESFSKLLEYISPSAFEVVEWQGVVKKSAKVSRQLLLKTGVEKLKADMEPHLPPAVLFSKAGNTQTEDPRAAGENLLELYFYQVYHQRAVFLDLRKERFHYRPEGGLSWHPNGLWITFNATFSDGIRKLYDGFFLVDETRLNQALKQLGLAPDHLTDAALTELKQLLEEHFGQGRSQLIRFETKGFMQSFDKLFSFLKKHRVKISEDFLFLGIYLVTLYLHLDAIGSAYDVTQAFQRGRRGTT